MLTEGDHDNMRGFAPEPTERMTDERLAEIEATLYEDTDNVEELLQALKAERAEVVRLCESNAALVRVEISQQKAIEAAEAKLREANAEIERQQGLVRNYLETIEGNEIDISGLLEKLRAVGELQIPNLLRALVHEDLIDGGEVVRKTADELEALLKTNDESRTRPIQGGYLEKDTTTGEVHEPTTQRDWTSDAWAK